jgi:hypothetical protein
MNHVITIKGQKVELTTAETKKLLAELSEVFSEKVPLVIERERLVPYPVFQQPIIHHTIPQWPPDLPYCLPSTTCRSN